MNIQPSSDYVVIKLNKVEDLTSSGIIIANIYVDERHGEGVVVAVGPGKTLPNGVVHPMTVKPGDRVIFTPHSGIETKINGEKFVMMKETEILAVID